MSSRDSRASQGRLKNLLQSVVPRGRRTRRTLGAMARRGDETVRCPRCGFVCDSQRLAVNLYVCPNCGYHHRISALQWVKVLLDGGEISEFAAEVTTANPTDFPDYESKVAETRAKTGLDEAVVTGFGNVEGHRCCLAIMSFTFMGGSMGSVVGERITRAMLYAAKENVPFIAITASGGARMQEGIFSLMQMAKTSHASALLSASGQPFFVVLSDPTTGGVSASFSMLGDVTLAEPGALIGFAGPRVIAGTIRQKLPAGFQRAEFQRDKGFVDMVVPRSDLRSTLAYLMETHAGEAR